MLLKWNWLIFLLFFLKNTIVFAITEEQIRKEYSEKDLSHLFEILNYINTKTPTSNTKEGAAEQEEEIKIRKKVLSELISDKENLKSISNSVDKNKNTTVIKNIFPVKEAEKNENQIVFRKLTNSIYLNVDEKWKYKFQEQNRQVNCNNNENDDQIKFLKLLKDNKKIFSVYKTEKTNPDCLSLIKKFKIIRDAENMSCDTIPPDEVGDSGAKVFILKKDNEPKYVIKSFKNKYSCSGEISKLNNLNRELENTEIAAHFNPNNIPYFKIPNKLFFAKLIESNPDSDPCFIVLESAKGKPVYFYAKNYINGIEKGTSEIFYELGVVIGELHKENIARNSNKTISDLKTVSHGDLHIKNIFYDRNKKKFTLIDNKEFGFNKRNYTDILNILTILRQMVIDIKKGNDSLNHKEGKITRATSLATKFINGYIKHFNKNEYDLKNLFDMIKFVSNAE